MFSAPADRSRRAVASRPPGASQAVAWVTLKPVCLAAALAVAGPALALPSGAQVTAGQVQVGTPQGGQLVIRQDTAKAGIDWQGFSIGAGEKVQVQQPNANAVLFNRVVGADPSVILGQLQANGRVFLSNPRGILFGAGSQVSVGGLVATTLDIDPQALANGRYQLTRGLGQPGELRAEGDIQASGTVALVAPTLVQSGTISAARVGLAAAGAVQVDVEGDGLIFFNVRHEDLATRLSLLGSVLADGGSVEARAVARSGFADTVLNMDGIVRARGLGQREGRVVIDGGPAGITQLAGTVDVSGLQPGEHGGQATVLGEKVLLTGSARVDARGDAGGGTVLVGGNWQGKGPEANAQMTYVASGAKLDASAVGQGNGGTVVTWADDWTRFYGSVRAEGGALGGNGGQVEVSGKRSLDFRGSFSAAAPKGQAGLLLLDPEDIEIVETGTSNVGDTGSGGGAAFEVTDSSLAPTPQLGWDTISAALGSGSVLVTTSGTGGITVVEANPTPLTGGNTLTLRAAGSITVDAAITRGSGAGGLSLDAQGGSITLNAPLITANGTIALTSSAGMTIGTLTAGTGAIDISNGGAANATGVISGGSLTKSGAGVLTLSGNNSYSGPTLVAGGTLRLGSSTGLPTGGAVTLNGATLDLNGTSPTVGAVTLINSTITGSGALTSNDSATGFDVRNGNIAATLAGSARLTKSTSGTLTISAAQSYTGGTVINDGTLQINSGGGLLDTGTVAINSASAVLGVGVNDQVGAVTLNGGSITGSGTLTSNDGVTGFDVRSGSIAATLGGSAALTKSTSDTVTISAAQSYTGGTVINGGTLQVNGGGLLDTGSVAINGATAVLGVGVNDQVGAVTLNGGSITGSGTLTSNDGVTGFDVRSGSIGATLGGSAALTKSTSDTVTISAAQSYTGGTVINGGTLQVNGGGLLDTGSVAINGATAVLGVGVNDQVGAVTLNGGSITGSGTLTSNDGVTGFDVRSGSINATLGGSAALTKSTSDTVTIGAAQSYTGGTVINGGTLQVNGGGLLDTGSVAINGATAVLGVGVNDQVGAVTLNGGSITGSGTLTSNDGVTGFDVRSGSIAATLGGSAALTKSTSGTVTISAAQSYTGGTNVDAGTLQVNAGGSLPDGGAVGISGSSTVLDLASGVDDTVGAVTLVDGSITGGGTLRAGSYELRNGSVSATLAGGGSVLKTTSGIVTFNTPQSYAGGTTIDAGTLRLAGTGALADTGALTLNGATAVFDLGTLSDTVGVVTLTDGSLTRSGSGTLTGSAYNVVNGTVGLVLAGGGALAKSGSGTVTLTEAQTYTGGTTITGGTLALGGANGALANTGALTLNGATAVFDLGTLSDTVGVVTLTDGNLTRSGSGTLTGSAYNMVNGNVGLVLAGSGALTKSGSGTVTLTEAQTYAGGTTITGGTLALGGTNGALANTGALTLNGATAVFSIGNLSDTVADVTLTDGSLTRSGSGTLTGSSYSVSNGSVALSLAGTAGLTKSGSGTVTITAPQAYAGPNTLDDGTLRVSGTGSLGSGNITLAAPATLDVVAGATVGNDLTSNGGVLSSSTGGGTLTGNATLAATTTVSSDDATTGLSLTGNRSGSGGLVKDGSGLVRLAGSASYSGATLVSDGVLRLVTAAALPATTALSLDGSQAELDLNGNAASAGSLNLIDGRLSGSGSLTAATYTVQAGTLAATLAGSGALTKSTAGVLTITAAQTYTGGSTVAAGTLQLSGAGRLADTGALTLTGTNAVLDVGVSDTMGVVTLTDGRITGSGVLTGSRYDVSNGRIEAQLAGAGALNKSGTGTVTVAAAQSYTGGSTVDGGTLRLSGSGALADGGSLTVNGSSAVFDLGSLSDTVGAVSLVDGSITGTGSLSSSAGFAVRNGSISAVLAGSGGLTKSTAGVVSLSAANTYTGNTQIDAGTLQLDGAGARAGQGAVTLATGATLDLHDGAVLANPSLTSTGGTLLASSGASRIDSAVSLNGSTTVRVNGGASLMLQGVASGSGDLVKTGQGAFTLAASNNFSGALALDEGSLQLSGTTASAGSGALTLAAGSTLALSAGATLSNASLVSQGGSVSSGTGGGSIQSPITLAASTTFNVVDVVNGLNLNGAVDGAASANLVKAGAGRLTLAADNRYAGATLVNAGSLATQGDERLPDATALQLQAGSTLVLGGSETLGLLSGSGAVQLGSFGLATGTAGESSFSGSLAGTAGSQLSKQGNSRFSLQGTVDVARLAVQQGTLVLDGAADQAATAALQVARAGIVELQGDKTVADLQLAGQLLPGTTGATLGTPGTYALQDGAVVQANLGAGSLTSNGATQLQGLSAASNVAVQTGTLTLTGANRLASTAQVQVLAGATLSLAEAQALGQLALSGSVNGGGLLTADLAALSGGSVFTPLNVASLTSQGTSVIGAAVAASGTAQLQSGLLTLDGGSLTAPVIDVAGGTLATTSAGRLSTAELQVRSGAELQLAGAESVTGLLVQGRIDGPGSLTATEAVMDGGSLNAALSTTTLRSTGGGTLAAAVQAGSTSVTGGSLLVDTAGTLQSPTIAVQGGELRTASANRLLGDIQLSLGDGARLTLGGDQTLTRLADAAGTDGSALLTLVSGALTVGDASDATFSGRISGDGGLTKQGAGTFTLASAADNDFTGATRVLAGTLSIARDGLLGRAPASATAGQLLLDGGTLRVTASTELAASRGLALQGAGGTLEVADGQTLTYNGVAADGAGSGRLTKTGGGTLSLGGANIYSGSTAVQAGRLRTVGNERLPDATALTIASGATLDLGGAETLQSLDAQGTASLAGSVTTQGDQRYAAPVTVVATTPIRLTAGGALSATAAGNDWHTSATQPLSIDAASVQLSTLQASGGTHADLVLGDLRVTAGDSRIDAGLLNLAGTWSLEGSAQLALVSHATPTYAAADVAPGVVDPDGRVLHMASDVITQSTGSRITSADGSGLLLVSVAGGSIRLGQEANDFGGHVAALSSNSTTLTPTSFGSAWTANVEGGGVGAALPARQSVITLAGQNLRIGSQTLALEGGGSLAVNGVAGDLVRLTAGTLRTAPGSLIRARLWYNDAAFGTIRSTPGLQLTLLDPLAYEQDGTFGNSDAPIAVEVGAITTDAPRAGLSAGFVQILPKNGARGSTAIYLTGPRIAAGLYSFFHDGAGQLSEVPVLYNGFLPASPQLSGSLSSVASVSEQARKERFEEAVRTENVAVRLRAGVIAEVGPGRPATQGSDGIRLPEQCEPSWPALDCAK